MIAALKALPDAWRIAKGARLGLLSPHFHVAEFGSRDGRPVPYELYDNVRLLAEQLEALRHEVGDVPIRILSGYRSPEHNARVKGAEHSQHLLAKAADIVIAGRTPEHVAQTIERLIGAGKMMEGGLGLYRGWVHYDVRGTRARWRRL